MLRVLLAFLLKLIIQPSPLGMLLQCYSSAHITSCVAHNMHVYTILLCYPPRCVPASAIIGFPVYHMIKEV